MDAAREWRLRAGLQRPSSRVGWLWQGRYKAILVQDGPYLKECSRYIHLNPNRAKLTRPAERYRWSSYRNYVGGPKAAPWVETRAILGESGGDRAIYRAYVEAGKGEKQVSPFERAVARLVLGSEEFLAWVRRRVKGRADTPDEPSLRDLRRTERALPERVERAVEEAFAEEGPARKRRLLLYAQRLYSRLRPAEIARRYGRTRGAVTLAAQQLGAEARRNAPLAAGLRREAEILAGIIVLRHPRPTQAGLQRLVRQAVAALPGQPLAGRLWIVESERIRIHEPLQAGDTTQRVARPRAPSRPSAHRLRRPRLSSRFPPDSRRCFRPGCACSDEGR